MVSLQRLDRSTYLLSVPDRHTVSTKFLVSSDPSREYNLMTTKTNSLFLIRQMFQTVFYMVYGFLFTLIHFISFHFILFGTKLNFRLKIYSMDVILNEFVDFSHILKYFTAIRQVTGFFNVLQEYKIP